MSTPDDRATDRYSDALLRMTEVALAAYIANPRPWNLGDTNVGEAAARAAYCAMNELHRLLAPEDRP